MVSIVPNINRLEKWLPIKDWDNNIDKLPKDLKKDWQIITKMRDNFELKQLKGERKELLAKRIRKLLEEDVPFYQAFTKAGVSYTRKRAESLGLVDSILQQRKRFQHVYVKNIETNETRVFPDIQAVIEYTKLSRTTINRCIRTKIGSQKYFFYSYEDYKKLLKNK